MTARGSDLPRGDLPPGDLPPGDLPPGDLRSKDEWRRSLLAARRALDPAVRADRAAALTRHALALVAGVRGPVCAYLPIGTEPWSADGVSALREAGHEVLLPVVPADGPLDWAVFDGALRDGPIGLREPAGPRLGAGAVRRAALLLLPGLAVDRAGTRLGRGAGHYDRTLPLVAPGVPLVMVLHDEELVDRLPAEPHDHPVDAVLLPGGGHTRLGNSG